MRRLSLADADGPTLDTPVEFRQQHRRKYGKRPDAAGERRLLDTFRASFGDRSTLFLAEADGRALAFALLLDAGPVHHLWMTGTDYDDPRSRHAYFEVAFHAPVQTGYAAGVTELSFSYGTETAKAQRGAGWSRWTATCCRRPVRRDRPRPRRRRCEPGWTSQGEPDPAAPEGAPMRTAVLADVHGNLPALEACLAAAVRAGTERLVLGGDIVAGPFPAQTAARVVLCGHIHVQYDRRLASGRRVVNAGSVGLPYEGDPAAFWALLREDGEIELRRTDYDVPAARRRMRTCGFPGGESYAEEMIASPAGRDEAIAVFESRRS